MSRVLFLEPGIPGVGCLTPMPEQVYRYLDTIAGVVMPLDEALTELQLLFPEATYKCYGDMLTAREVRMVDGFRWTFHWKVITYVELEDE